jgi:hypothetical protein
VCTHPETIGPCADDANPCTSDVCSGGLCTHPANTAACNDGLVCTLNDICGAGLCMGTSNCPSGQICSSTTGQCAGGAGDTDNDGLDGAGDLCPTDPRNRCAGPVRRHGDRKRSGSIATCPPRLGAQDRLRRQRGSATYNQLTKASVCTWPAAARTASSVNPRAVRCDNDTTEDIFQ